MSTEVVYKILPSDVGSTKICVEPVTQGPYDSSSQYVKVTINSDGKVGDVVKQKASTDDLNVLENEKAEEPQTTVESQKTAKYIIDIIANVNEGVEDDNSIISDNNKEFFIKCVNEYENIDNFTLRSELSDKDYSRIVNPIEVIIKTCISELFDKIDKQSITDQPTLKGILRDANTKINEILSMNGGFSMKSLTGKLFGSKKSKKRFSKRSFRKSKQSKRSGRKYRSTRRK
jgi:hypothetical protein